MSKKWRRASLLLMIIVAWSSPVVATEKSIIQPQAGIQEIIVIAEIQERQEDEIPILVDAINLEQNTEMYYAPEVRSIISSGTYASIGQEIAD